MRVEWSSLSMILKKFLKFSKSEPRDSYKLDSFKNQVSRVCVFDKFSRANFSILTQRIELEEKNISSSHHRLWTLKVQSLIKNCSIPVFLNTCNW